MGLFFRKSVGLGGGVRLNLSTSGVGVSAGVKGLRVSTGPRGSYITVGRHGIYYRQRIGGPYGQVSSRPVQTPPAPAAPGTAIPTADVQDLTDEDSAAVLQRLNAVINTPPRWTRIAGMGTLVSAVFGLPVVVFVVAGLSVLRPPAPPPLILASGAAAVICALVTLFAASREAQRDDERRIFSLTYDLDAAGNARWGAVRAALGELAGAARLTQLVSVTGNADWKYNAGVERVFGRGGVSLSQRPMPFVWTSQSPLCLSLGDQALYFLPDRIYVYQRGVYGAVGYGELSVEGDVMNIVEMQDVPADARVVGQRWEHMNKDGSPDLRFASNPHLSVCVYGRVLLRSNQGLSVVLETSNPDAAAAFAQGMDRVITDAAARPSPPVVAAALHPDGAAPSGTPPPELGDFVPCVRCGYLLTPVDEVCPRCHAAQPIRSFGAADAHTPGA